MPIRDFKCKECNKEFEKICKTDEGEAECKFCGGDSKAMVSAAKSFEFKGSGFYETDYKHK